MNGSGTTSWTTAHRRERSHRLGVRIPRNQETRSMSDLPTFVRRGTAIPSGGIRPRVEGKFLFVGDEKVFVKGTTYGAFRPNSQGAQFPEPDQVEVDFSLMRDAGINSILTYTVPPISLLDQALEHGMRVIVTVPWMEYVCFLQGRQTKQTIRHQVRQTVASCQRHPAVLMYCVGKEIPPPIVRWHGAKEIEVFLRELCETVKD